MLLQHSVGSLQNLEALAEIHKLGELGNHAGPVEPSAGLSMGGSSDGCADGRPAVKTTRCDSTTAAMAFLSTLKFSIDDIDGDAASLEDCLGKGRCPGCSKWARLYCPHCVRSVVPIPEPLHLGLQVLIFRHPKEAAAKSSATPLPLLSPDVQVSEWRPPCGSQDLLFLQSPGTWLVYPSESAVDVSHVKWEEVQRIVLVDSRWKHARTGLSGKASQISGIFDFVVFFCFQAQLL